MRCFILGNGPSLNETNLDLLVGEVSFGVNRCDLIYPKTKWRPTYWVCIDRDFKIPIEQWSEPFLRHYLMGETCFISPRHMPRLHALPFSEETWEKWTKARCWPTEWQKTITEMPRFHVLDACIAEHGTRLGHYEWFPKAWHLPRVCRFGGSIPASIQLAVKMGYKEVYLIGCDLGYVPFGTNHFDADYYEGEYHQEFTEEWAAYQEEALVYAHKLAAGECAARGIKILNAGVGGRLEAYPRVRLEDVV